MMPGFHGMQAIRRLAYGPAQNKAAALVTVSGAGDAGELEDHGAGRSVGQQQAARMGMLRLIFLLLNGRPVLLPMARPFYETLPLVARSEHRRVWHVCALPFCICGAPY